MNKTELKIKMNTPLSDEDLERSLGIRSDKIVKYSELKDYNNIEELLPTVNSFKIILIEDSYNSGHWTAICRGVKDYYYFNSYGSKYDTDWNFIPRMTRMILGQNTNDLTRLFKDVPHDWNKMKLQGEKTQVCGRWCVLFCIYCGKMMYTLKDFINMIKDYKKSNPKLSYDQICLELTKNI